MGMNITVAGVVVEDALAKLVRYSGRTRTLERYDLLGPGQPDCLTQAEIARTRVVSSRISKREEQWLLSAAADAPWSCVQADASLAHADPAEVGGLYDDMSGLYSHFRQSAPRGLAGAKISKVLHLKRPHLYPILDSHLLRVYSTVARQQGKQHPVRGHRRLYWAAVRADLLANADELQHLRGRLREQTDEQARRLDALSDLRLLDILAW
jgi:hypothetical protein